MDDWVDDRWKSMDAQILALSGTDFKHLALAPHEGSDAEERPCVSEGEELLASAAEAWSSGRNHHCSPSRRGSVLVRGPRRHPRFAELARRNSAPEEGAWPKLDPATAERLRGADTLRGAGLDALRRSPDELAVIALNIFLEVPHVHCCPLLAPIVRPPPKDAISSSTIRRHIHTLVPEMKLRRPLSSFPPGAPGAGIEPNPAPCLVQMELDKRLRVPVPSVQGLILAVRARMLDNAYHNWSHVVDVTQATPVPALLPGKEVGRDCRVAVSSTPRQRSTRRSRL